MGIRMKPNTNLLYVADAFLGLFKVDLTSRSKQLVLSSKDPRFGSLPLKFVNDLDFDGDIIYFIDTSNYNDFNGVFAEHTEAWPRGRLFSFDECHNRLEFLRDNLYFPNGLQLTPYKDALLINENTMSRIIK